MAQPSILVGTFSIFEYLILKQMYPNFKTIMIITHVSHLYHTTITQLYHNIIFGGSEYISCDNDVSFSPNSNFSPYQHIWKCFTLRILWVLVCCGKFHKKSVRGKVYKLCMNKFASLRLFPKSFYQSFVLEMTPLI